MLYGVCILPSTVVPELALPDAEVQQAGDGLVEPTAPYSRASPIWSITFQRVSSVPPQSSGVLRQSCAFRCRCGTKPAAATGIYHFPKNDMTRYANGGIQPSPDPM